jgi:hypothetical protein
VVNWVLSPLSFFLRESTHTTYIFTAPTSTTTIITLEPCALNAEFQNENLIKFPYFVDTTERGDSGEREGDIKDNFIRLILILY